MPRLQFNEADKSLFVHMLKPGRTVIGRSDRCDVALPSESVSRVHCIVERRGDGWMLADRSRNGTGVNNRVVKGDEQAVALAHGDVVRIGDYTARFLTADDPVPAGSTTTTPFASALHEEPIDIGPDGVAVARVELEMTKGPHAGRIIALARPRCTIGGPGSDIEIGEQYPRGAVRIRVVRGRAMIEAGDIPTFLAGSRVRELTPVMNGEEVRIGEHAFLLRSMTAAVATESPGFGEMVGESAPMRRVFGALEKMAGHDDPVLLIGESGTGKEVAARALHDAGPRHQGPFVAVNCAAITESLFESELFGHEKGSFTGADRRQDGAFQQAAGGTLFLDEIGELKLDMQGKLLRALESGEVRRVGGSAAEYPDARVVAATNRDLAQLVKQGRFRGDLYFRLAVLTIQLPPLRERPADIGLLARIILERSHPGAVLGDDALAALQAYDWPGNVRELRNVLTRAYVMHGTPIAASAIVFHPWSFDGDARPVKSPPAASIYDPERERLAEALAEARGNKARAAQILGIPRSSLLYKLTRHGLNEK